jgi:hypothetical protein
MRRKPPMFISFFGMVCLFATIITCVVMYFLNGTGKADAAASTPVALIEISATQTQDAQITPSPEPTAEALKQQIDLADKYEQTAKELADVQKENNRLSQEIIELNLEKDRLTNDTAAKENDTAVLKVTQTFNESQTAAQQAHVEIGKARQIEASNEQKGLQIDYEKVMNDRLALDNEKRGQWILCVGFFAILVTCFFSIRKRGQQSENSNNDDDNTSEKEDNDQAAQAQQPQSALWKDSRTDGGLGTTTRDEPPVSEAQYRAFIAYALLGNPLGINKVMEHKAKLKEDERMTRDEYGSATGLLPWMSKKGYVMPAVGAVVLSNAGKQHASEWLALHPPSPTVEDTPK